MSVPLWQIKKNMCEIGRRIWQRGFCAGNEGNHSVRLGPNRFLCTPTGVSKGFLEPEDLCVVDIDGNQIEPNSKGRSRTSEVLVHLAIYKRRPDVNAVIHSHPAHAVAFCLAGIPLPEGLHPEAEVFLGRVIFAKYATPGKPSLAESFLDLITDQTNTILMANHGSVTFGEDLFQTYYKLEILDNYCKELLLAKQLGQITPLNREQVVDLMKVKGDFGLGDDRTQCAVDGCVGENNQAFLASFDQTMSATCDCGNGQVTQTTNPVGQGQNFDNMVKMITDQIMASMKK